MNWTVKSTFRQGRGFLRTNKPSIVKFREKNKEYSWLSQKLIRQRIILELKNSLEKKNKEQPWTAFEILIRTFFVYDAWMKFEARTPQLI